MTKLFPAARRGGRCACRLAGPPPTGRRPRLPHRPQLRPRQPRDDLHEDPHPGRRPDADRNGRSKRDRARLPVAPTPVAADGDLSVRAKTAALPARWLEEERRDPRRAGDIVLSAGRPSVVVHHRGGTAISGSGSVPAARLDAKPAHQRPHRVRSIERVRTSTVVGGVVRFTSTRTSVDVTIGQDNPPSATSSRCCPDADSRGVHRPREDQLLQPRKLRHSGSPGSDPRRRPHLLRPGATSASTTTPRASATPTPRSISAPIGLARPARAARRQSHGEARPMSGPTYDFAGRRARHRRGAGRARHGPRVRPRVRASRSGGRRRGRAARRDRRADRVRSPRSPSLRRLRRSPGRRRCRAHRCDIRPPRHGLQQRGIQAPPSDTADEPTETFERVNAINLRGVWACMKHELRQMREQGAGRSSTARRSAVSSVSPAAPPTTRRSTACSTHQSAALEYASEASASTRSAPARSTRRWSLRWRPAASSTWPRRSATSRSAAWGQPTRSLPRSSGSAAQSELCGRRHATRRRWLHRRLRKEHL